MKLTNNNIYQEIKELLYSAKNRVYQAINTTMTQTYFQIGKRIVEEEQGGEIRAEYGSALLKNLSSELIKEFGKGYSEQNLKNMRQFYLIYQKRQTVSSEFKLSWSHYIFLTRIENINERNFYEIESIENSWSLRELKRQFDSGLFERLKLSSDKQKVKELSLSGQVIQTAQDLIKDPYILEFVGLPELSSYSESELEQKLIDRFEKTDDENSTIGIILCKDKSKALVELTLPKDNNQIYASKYLTILPNKEEFKKLLEDE
ncbi:PDDEXK nuclease domain-containing protein [Aliarcobacter cryaerophilus]|uniref:PDDEXK nuclease domain-containing protein n=1 Tax=Aliarcobacter cryaerophilus TaxID=28198 RepID=UPI0021B30F30|nr:PDDEXK nuclease domain-containing protein [Aliarcobacter cryaerophilus]MCT7462142.1 PDDEXK nuclease domain-containing protein [Aliarcobacter cryaerophilus]MCT7512648.1 PDDEXK nuclease domain-containing protein [Aliarcobacter cryaerophilus]